SGANVRAHGALSGRRFLILRFGRVRPLDMATGSYRASRCFLNVAGGSRMKTVTLHTPPTALALPRTRFADYLELTKPRIAVLVLFTVAGGAMLAAGRSVHLPVLLNTLLGTALVAAGASALNQLLERNSDALMRRTENRPLPAGRLHPLEVLVFGRPLRPLRVPYLISTPPPPGARPISARTCLRY